MNLKSIAIVALALAFTHAGIAQSDQDNRAPEVPTDLQISSADFKVSFHAYAVGVQIYHATPSSADPTKLVWTFTGPDAVLFDSSGEIVGAHYAYAGPTRPAWQSNSGGFVVAMRAAPPVTVDPNSIPWLLLSAVKQEGPGILSHTALIHRVNTSGGLPPANPPRYLGEEIRVTYTAEYFFYRAQD